MIIIKEFTFDAAHQLSWHRGKCQNLHGHTYKLQVGVKGKPNSDGIIMDFGELNKIVNERIIEWLDHKLLNEIFENPTAELMALEILKKLAQEIKNIQLIRLWETPTSFVEVSNEDL